MQNLILILESHQIYSGKFGNCRKLSIYQETLWASNGHDLEPEISTFLNVLGVWRNK